MTLATLQQAIAELICDTRSLQAYKTDQKAWLRERALDPEDADVLTALDHASLQAFQDIHARDRAYFVDSVLPLTTQRLGETWWKPYFDTHPYGDDDTRAEVERFIRWLETTSTDRAAISLAKYERAKFALLDEPIFEPAPGNILRDPAAASLAPGLAVILVDVHIPSLIDEPTRKLGAQKGIVLLRRDPDGVTSAWVDGAAGVMLHLIARGETEDIRTLLATRSGQDAYMEILTQAALV